MISDLASQAQPPDTQIVKIRLDTDYDSFVAGNSIASFLSAIARSTGLSDSEVSLLSLRSGCVIVVLRLPNEAAAMLFRQGLTADVAEGLTEEQIELLSRVQKVSLGDTIEAPYLRRQVTLEPDLTWLHLSDLHIDEDYDKNTTDTHADLTRFLNNFPTCLEKAHISPDIVFFTGDVADKAYTKQYRVAEKFFDEVKRRLPVPTRGVIYPQQAALTTPFFFVPGNHDVNWGDIDKQIEKEMRKLLKAGKMFEELPEPIREHASKRLKNYAAFARSNNNAGAKKLNVQAYAKCFRAGRKNVEVGVAGLNSAWLSTRKDLYNDIDDDIPDIDLQHLVLGPMQIRSAKAELESAAVRVALVHHPPESEWYRDYDRALQRTEMNFFDFVLRGHQHEPQAAQGVDIAGSGDYVQLAPAALRTRPAGYQGFMAVELDFGQELMRITAWTVSYRAQKWIIDQEFGENGVDTRPLPEGTRRPRRYRGGKKLTESGGFAFIAEFPGSVAADRFLAHLELTR